MKLCPAKKMFWRRWSGMNARLQGSQNARATASGPVFSLNGCIPRQSQSSVTNRASTSAVAAAGAGSSAR